MKNHTCEHSLSLDDAKELLALHGFNQTKAKQAILMKIAKAASPVSVAEIHKSLGQETCNVSTIFRTLNQFREKNLIKEINLGEDFCRYEMSKKGQHAHHHHHIRCRDCGVIKPIEKCELTQFEKVIRKLGFKEMEHFLEFTGLCSKCS